MSITNREVAEAAYRGQNAVSGSGNMSTDHYRPEFKRSYAPYTGYLPARLEAILHARFAAGAISQVVYSYSTPIAWKDGDTWIVPAVRYSATTSTRHMPPLSILHGKSIPWDAGMDEYQRVLEGIIEYDRHTGPYGTYRVLAAA